MATTDQHTAPTLRVRPVAGALVLLAMCVLVAACTTTPGRSGAIPGWTPRPPTERGVRYGPDPAHVADIHRRIAGESAGTLVYVHGGSFVGGWREQIALTNPELLGLTSLGWSVITVDYRLDVDDRRIGAQVDDVRRALQWVAEQGPAHGLDTSTVVAAGQSAGGTLVMLGAADATKEWPADAWVALAAVSDIGWWAALTGSVVPTRESLVELSPVRRIAGARTPGYVVHATDDPFVPVAQARLLVRTARAGGVEVGYDEVGAEDIATAPGCHPHSVTCAMDDASFLTWLTDQSGPPMPFFR